MHFHDFSWIHQHDLHDWQGDRDARADEEKKIFDEKGEEREGRDYYNGASSYFESNLNFQFTRDKYKFSAELVVCNCLANRWSEMILY